MRHGMTMGEMGHWFIRHFGLDVDYRVIEMDGWQPDGPGYGWPDDRIWINSSPNDPVSKSLSDERRADAARNMPPCQIETKVEQAAPAKEAEKKAEEPSYIGYEDWTKINIIAVKVVKAEAVEGADRNRGHGGSDAQYVDRDRSGKRLVEMYNIESLALEKRLDPRA